MQVNIVLSYIGDLAITSLPEEPDWNTLGVDEAALLERQRLEERNAKREGRPASTNGCGACACFLLAADVVGPTLTEDEIEAFRAMVQQVRAGLTTAQSSPVHGLQHGILNGIVLFARLMR
eukprot:scaffold1564_cov389-Prasinococcus_capsulatus_cf.AAC.30